MTATQNKPYVVNCDVSHFAKASKLEWNIATDIYWVDGEQVKRKRSYGERLAYLITLFDYSDMTLPECVTIEEIAKSVHTIYALKGKKVLKKNNMVLPLVFVEEDENFDGWEAFYISDGGYEVDEEA